MGEHFRQEQVSEQQQILEMLLTLPKAALHVTPEDQEDYFETKGTASLNNGVVTLTNTKSQAGSYTLKNKIDMNESFTLTGKINLGEAYERRSKNGHDGGDGIAAVFSTGAIGEIGNANGNGSGASLGMGGDNLKGSFGFKLDTWHNTGAPKPENKASADPKYSGYLKRSFWEALLITIMDQIVRHVEVFTLLSAPLRS